MIANHIHHALAQVKALQQLVERRRFHGYSGRARMVSGCIVIAAAVLLVYGPVPATAEGHLVVWGGVFAMSLLMNYGALLYWFLNDPEVNRQWRRLAPALDVVPPLLVGGVVTVAMILDQRYDYLFGMWMCLFGLANFSSRHLLPRATGQLGLFYMLGGGLCLLSPSVIFLNPWPMAVVFGLGELAGGLILHFDQTRKLSD